MLVIIFGIILLAIGPFLVIKSDYFVENFGRIEWAEQHLGGGTFFFYKLLGVIFIFVGLLMVFNLFGPLLLWILSPIIPKPKV